VIVIGGYVNALGLVRAAAARGIEAAVVSTQPYDIAHLSRSCAAHDVVRGPDREGSLLEVLLRRAHERPGWLLLPTDDEALLTLARHRDRLAKTYRVAAPSWHVARTLVDKQLLLEAASAAGATLPRSWGPAAPEIADRPEIVFPVVVKPRIGYRFVARFGVKLFVARDRAELLRAVERLSAAGLEGAVFDLVPGGDDRIYAYCTYVDASGTAYDGVTVRKLRQGPPFFGVARVARTVAEIPELRATTLALVRRLGFRGFVAAEFKHDPRDGTFRFFEANGRSVIYNALLRAAGLDIAALSWADHVDGRVVPWSATACGGTWINAHADVLYSALWRRADPVPLAKLVAPYVRQRIDAVWSARDPYPFLTQWARSARDGGRALLRVS